MRFSLSNKQCSENLSLGSLNSHLGATHVLYRLDLARRIGPCVGVLDI